MGEKPEAPESLSQEGHDFVDKCLQHDPKDRMTAMELLEQNFCKVPSIQKYFIKRALNNLCLVCIRFCSMAMVTN